MTSRRDTLRTLAAGVGTLLAPSAFTKENSPTALKDIASLKGLRFGNAMGLLGDERRARRFGDPAYRALMARECNMFVAENETKWQAFEPRPGVFNTAPADELLAWARKESMAIRGHTVMWQSPQWMPAWVNQLDLGAQPGDRAARILAERVKSMCQHLGSDVVSYDVINEAVAPQDGKLIDNVLSKHLGVVGQIDMAFRLTRAQAPNAELVYNDYMGPSKDSGKHRAGVLKLLAELKKRGTPIDSLGLQSHLGIHDSMTGSGGVEVAREWRAFLDEVVGMGYGLVVTELDVSDKGLPADIATRDAATAELARNYLELTLSYPVCRDLLVWGLADHVSWLQDWKDAKRPDGLAQRPTPYDSALRAKPMRAAIADVLRSIPERAPSARATAAPSRQT